MNLEYSKLFTKNIKLIKELHSSKGRRKYNQFIVEGYKTLAECAISDNVLEYIVLDSKLLKNIKNFEKIPKKYLDKKIYETDDFNKISTLTNSEGILGVFSKEKLNKDESIDEFLIGKKKVIVLFDINDPGNFGTILRTALWFGIDGIILVGNTVDVFSPKVVRASMGAIFKMNVFKLDNFNNHIKSFSDFYKIGTFLDKDKNIDTDKIIKIEKKMILFGNEANGLDDELFNHIDANYIIESNKSKNFESLNLSIAAGIAIFAIFENN